MDYNLKFSNINMNPFITLNSFDSNNSNQALYNMTQPNDRIGFIRLNITHIPSITTRICKIISTLHRVNGDSPPLR